MYFMVHFSKNMPMGVKGGILYTGISCRRSDRKKWVFKQVVSKIMVTDREMFYNNSELKSQESLYVNIILHVFAYSTLVVTRLEDSSGVLLVGAAIGQGQRYQGLMQDVRIYSRMLDEK